MQIHLPLLKRSWHFNVTSYGVASQLLRYMVRKSSDNNKPEVNVMSHDLKLSHKRMSVVYAG